MCCHIQKVSNPLNGSWTTVRAVRNLGWILRNWKQVARITVEPKADGGAWVFWYLHDGRRFVSDFASREVLRGFLDRPVFRGLVVTWNSRMHVIGSETYRAMRESYEADGPVS